MGAGSERLVEGVAMAEAKGRRANRLEGCMMTVSISVYVNIGQVLEETLRDCCR